MAAISSRDIGVPPPPPAASDSPPGASTWSAPLVAVNPEAEQREVHVEDGLERALVTLVLHQRRAQHGTEHRPVVDRDVLERAHGVEVLRHRDGQPGGPQLVHEPLEHVEQRERRAARHDGSGHR